MTEKRARYDEEGFEMVENPKLPDDDHGTPTLASLLILETMKWGALLFLVYLAIRMLDPLWTLLYVTYRQVLLN